MWSSATTGVGNAVPVILTMDVMEGEPRWRMLYSQPGFRIMSP